MGGETGESTGGVIEEIMGEGRREIMEEGMGKSTGRRINTREYGKKCRRESIDFVITQRCFAFHLGRRPSDHITSPYGFWPLIKYNTLWSDDLDRSLTQARTRRFSY